MILQALKDYYDRKAADPEGDIAPLGLEWKPLEFLIVIKNDGDFVAIEDLRQPKGKKLVGKRFLIPRSIPRSGSKSYATTFLLWDHIGYLLGLPADDQKSPKQLGSWIDSLNRLPDSVKKEPAVGAVIKFYEKNQTNAALLDPNLEACLKSVPCNMSFRLDSDLMPVAGKPAVLEYAKAEMSSLDEEDGSLQTGYCLVSGELDVIKKTHAKTPINKDNNSLVSFQVNSGYDSYGKEKALNAPIGRISEFAYITALNTLLKSDYQRLAIADSVCVFWSARESHFESEFSYLFDESRIRDDPDQFSNHVKALYSSIESGAYLDDECDQKFFVLNLTPGGGTRISVRDWQVGTIGEFAVKVRQYYEDLRIVKPPSEPEFYSLWRLFISIATQDKIENIPPNVAGDFMRSILAGTPYPQTLLQAVLRRIRSDSSEWKWPARAAMVKAILNRYLRTHPNKNEKEIEMALDIEQPSVGYQLGRLFAALEKIQEEGNPGINSTIRERYYGAACSSPVTVFGTLMRLKNHHLAKIENKGRVVNLERLVSEIVGNLDDFPAHLDLHGQGRFAIGYYHQRQDLFTKKDNQNA